MNILSSDDTRHYVLYLDELYNLEFFYREFLIYFIYLLNIDLFKKKYVI